MRLFGVVSIILCFVFIAHYSARSELVEDLDAVNHIVFKTIPKLVGYLQEKNENSPGLIKNTIAFIKAKAKSLKSKLKTTGENENDLINKVVVSVGKSVEGMQDAMSSQDPKEFLLSCLDLVSSLASLTGPHGKMLSDILGIISGFVKMFQETPKVESQESMIKR